ncbi:putative ribonuclease H protein [Vitis vinifera]|uniref:Putative ribonuclease H protein n=1 Tax=Vitis vinifera TaxID=29760 RepID=A0A438J9K6_VITVI|nr:putative ribonuclease H protein [Vitis vinifera]
MKGVLPFFIPPSCEAKRDDMTFLSWILCWFEAALGLRINLAKSEIIPVEEVEEILEMAVELGCKVGQLPSTYLGLPLGVPNKAVCAWDGVEERMRWKLALWKRQYISKGGRIALIKSTLASMPLYQMSLFRMPRAVARRLEKLQRDFLWGGESTERKAHLVNWERVCVGKEKGTGVEEVSPFEQSPSWKMGVEICSC